MKESEGSWQEALRQKEKVVEGVKKELKELKGKIDDLLSAKKKAD